MGETCTDNRFEVIKKYKQKLIEGTNIEQSPKEMEVIDSILFRFWQMGWLKEVIRCKDCKHRPKIDDGDVENYTANGFGLEFPDDFECPCRCEDPYYSWMPKDDWYCGNGERKEE